MAAATISQPHGTSGSASRVSDAFPSKLSFRIVLEGERATDRFGAVRHVLTRVAVPTPQLHVDRVGVVLARSWLVLGFHSYAETHQREVAHFVRKRLNDFLYQAHLGEALPEAPGRKRYVLWIAAVELGRHQIGWRRGNGDGHSTVTEVDIKAHAPARPVGRELGSSPVDAVYEEAVGPVEVRTLAEKGVDLFRCLEARMVLFLLFSVRDVEIDLTTLSEFAVKVFS